MSLGKRIKQARENKGLSQRELAALTGLRQQMISKLETGQSAATSHIAKIADVLGVDPLWLDGIREDQGQYNINVLDEDDDRLVLVLKFMLKYAAAKLAEYDIEDQVDFFAQCLRKAKQASGNHKAVEKALIKVLRQIQE